MKLPQRLAAYVTCCFGLLIASSSSIALAANMEVLAKYEQGIVAAACQNGGAWLRCYKLNPLSCDSIMNPIVADCLNKLVANRPSSDANQVVAQIVSDQVLECVRAGFKGQHGGSKVDSEECGNVY